MESHNLRTTPGVDVVVEPTSLDSCVVEDVLALLRTSNEK